MARPASLFRKFLGACAVVLAFAAPLEASAQQYVFDRQFGGPASQQFDGVGAIAVDPRNGNVVVADLDNHRVQVFDSTGRYRRQMRDANGDPMHFSYPSGVAIDPLSQGIVVVDGFGAGRVYFFDSTGAYLRDFGGYGSGPGQFALASGIAIDPLTRDTYVGGSHRVQVFDSSGRYRREFGTEGEASGEYAVFTAVAIDPVSRKVFAADANTGRIKTFDMEGRLLSYFGSECTSLPCGIGKFQYLSGVAVDSRAQQVFVTDTGNDRIQVFTYAGVAVGTIGTSGTGNGQLTQPSSVAFDVESGNILAGDRNRVQTFNSTGDYLGHIGERGFGEGYLHEPAGVAVDPVSGDVVVADHGNHRIQVFDSGGRFLRQFGKAGSGAGQFREPRAVAIDPRNRNIVVADLGNSRVQIFDAMGTYLREFAADVYPYTSYPFHVAVDPVTREILVADRGIRVYAPDGTYLRSIGSLCQLYPCGAGEFGLPPGIAIDPANRNVVTVDGDHVQVFDAAGKFLMHFVSACPKSPCRPGELSSSQGVAVDPMTRNIMIVGPYGVDVFSAEGAFIARFGKAGFGDAGFWNPIGIAVDPRNRKVYVADYNNNRVQSFIPADTTVRTVVEYYNADLDNYFVTGDPVEQAHVETGAVGNWQRTGRSFDASGIDPVCRFYGNTSTDTATGRILGPNSHFYTANPVECATLKAIYDPDAPAWKFESRDFRIARTGADGTCAPGSVAVYRAYNNSPCVGKGSACKPQPNHRLTTDLNAIAEVVARGWVAEGAAMCALP